jgi:lipoate-protein ligase B
MGLIANVTQTIAAMEAEARRLEEDLQRMRQTTRQLLSKYQKDALWTAIHKSVFFYGCNKQNHIPRTAGNAANATFPQNRKPEPVLSSSSGRSMKSQKKTKRKSP